MLEMFFGPTPKMFDPLIGGALRAVGRFFWRI
jgi:hypothetical protein